MTLISAHLRIITLRQGNFLKFQNFLEGWGIGEAQEVMWKD